MCNSCLCIRRAFWLTSLLVLVRRIPKVIVLTNFCLPLFIFFSSSLHTRGMRAEPKIPLFSEWHWGGWARPIGGEQWQSSLISELPRRDKGPLKSQETEQSKSLRTFQEKQRPPKHCGPGRRSVSTSDENFKCGFISKERRQALGK